ncbi:unnamed protein product [Pieris macdunnoughi]|uniref:Uncharacterized protein n=1 Tax=Pieris macdunnoughi TaxID=345717 RepID=A0A821S6T7_9NEOP|nr:unnamed protein product [Pieris macdunnoughi]
MIFIVLVLFLVIECIAYPSVTTNKTESQYRYDIVNVTFIEQTKTENFNPKKNHTSDRKIYHLNKINSIKKENQQSVSRNFALIPRMDNVSFIQAAVKDTNESTYDRSQIEPYKGTNLKNNSEHTNDYFNQPTIENSNNSEANYEKDPMPLELNIFKGDECPSGFTKISDRCVKVDNKS